jgi:hypothetical protein
MLEPRTSLSHWKAAPPTIDRLLQRKTILVMDRAMKIAAGSRDRKILSNLSVKSKSPRQPTAAGPKESSFKQPPKSIRGVRYGTEAQQCIETCAWCVLRD